MKKHRKVIEVRFADIDVMGHVNNAVYLSYFEQARMSFFAELIGGEWDWNSHGILLARNEVDYLQPVQLHDHLEIEVWMEHIGTKSLVMAYEASIDKKGEKLPCTRGKSVLVCFDYRSQKTIPVPDEWKVGLS